MSKPNYLLLGWKPDARPNLNHGRTKGTKGDICHVPGSLPVLASGDAKTVIAAACAADCGVLLFEVSKKTCPRVDKPPVNA